MRSCCSKFLSFGAVRPNCKFYTPAEEQQLAFPKTTQFNDEQCFQRSASVLFFTSFNQKYWKYTWVQCKCQLCLSNQEHTELIAVEPPLCTFRAQHLSPTIQAQRLLRAQYLKSDTRWWASSLQSWAVQCVCCNLQLNEVHSAASISCRSCDGLTRLWQSGTLRTL